MSLTTNFIAELVRAANELEKLAMIEKARLLDRSVATIREMRNTIGIPASYAAADAVFDLQETQLMLISEEATDEQVKASLLEAADMIRTLRIVLDTRAQIVTNDPR